MTAGTNGTPENDDPFAYLYRQEGGGDPSGEGAAAAPQAPQPGVPRTSYNQVTRVGQTSYGQRATQGGGYGYPHTQPQAQTQQTAQYGQPTGQYGQQPPYPPNPGEPAPGGRAAARLAAHGGRTASTNRGLLIGAVAVVAAVALGIIIAVFAGDGGDANAADDSKPSASASAGGDGQASEQPGGSKEDAELPPVEDAAQLALGGGAQTSTEHSGANGAGGVYVDHMNTPGATATWTVKVPKPGSYQFNVRFGNAGDDATATVSVNGKPEGHHINLKNFSGADDWSDAWFTSYSIVSLEKGANTITVSCGTDDQCGFNLDQVAITEQGVKPAGW